MAEIKTIAPAETATEQTGEPIAVIVNGVRYLVAEAPDGYAGLKARALQTKESRDQDIASGHITGEPYAVEEEWPAEPEPEPEPGA